MNTPWGQADTVQTLPMGVIAVTTPGHGGFKVPPELWKKMPLYARETPYSKGGWFEEDCDWAFVFVCFPEITPENVAAAKHTLEGTYPEIVTQLKRDGIWDSGVDKCL